MPTYEPNGNYPVLEILDAMMEEFQEEINQHDDEFLKSMGIEPL